MRKALLTLFTDGTNEDLDYSKVLGAIGLVVFLGISYWAYGVKNKDFVPIEWAAGFTTILAGAAGVSKFKDKTVPEAKGEQQ